MFTRIKNTIIGGIKGAFCGASAGAFVGGAVSLEKYYELECNIAGDIAPQKNCTARFVIFDAGQACLIENCPDFLKKLILENAESILKSRIQSGQTDSPYVIIQFTIFGASVGAFIGAYRGFFQSLSAPQEPLVNPQSSPNEAKSSEASSLLIHTVFNRPPATSASLAPSDARQSVTPR